MKAVAGSVAQSKRIQLAKAAASFARFASSSAADNRPSCGERQCANAGFLRLASSAFGELMQGSKKKKGKRRSAEEGEEDDDGMMESEESDVKRLKMMM